MSLVGRMGIGVSEGKGVANGVSASATSSYGCAHAITVPAPPAVSVIRQPWFEPLRLGTGGK